MNILMLTIFYGILVSTTDFLFVIYFIYRLFIENEMQEALFMQGPYEKIFNNTLFSYGQPNLKEIFVIIDPKKLERSSSALWQKCPRCMLKSPADQISIVEDEEDDSN